MLIYKATNTLDGLIDDLDFTTDPAEAEVVVVGGKKVDLPVYPKLRGLFKTGVGTDNIPFEACQQRGVAVGLPSEATAAIIFDETANFACHLVLAMLYRGAGDFETWTKQPRSWLGAKKLLVVGTGRIGGRVAEKMGHFLQVDTFDTQVNAPAELEPKMRAADAVTLHLPLLAETTGWLDAEKLGWMADGAVVVNTARGPIVDDDALHAEIASGRLRAALDVFKPEPYNGCLRELEGDNLKLTPHIASTCREFLTGTADDFRAFLQQL